MDVHFTKPTKEQDPSITLADLFDTCNAAIDALLNKKNANLSRNFYSKFRDKKAKVKTDQWDGESLRQLNLLNARTLLLEGELALNGEDTQEAVRLLREADFTYSVHQVNEDDWVRVQNRYRLLHALAANRNSYSQRAAVCHNFDALKTSERLNALALKLFGRSYYYLILAI